MDHTSQDFNDLSISKPAGYDYRKTRLKSARFVVAPMVDQSELAWRLLSRRHGAELCYTPMFHANNFSKDPIYRRENFVTCEEDRPLIVQFCANDPSILLKACQFVAPNCEGVDLNLGCPQSIAKRGHYGAFLQDEWELVKNLISTVHRNLPVPISCKIRIFDDVRRTVDYAKMIEAAGCQLLTVHGRTRDQRGPATGLANWEQIKIVKECVRVPVFANGNVQYYNDVFRCIEETGVDGVMTAEGNLHNPYLFENRQAPIWEAALEYLDIVDRYPCPVSYVRGHLFKLFHHCLPKFTDLRERLALADSLSQFRPICEELKSRCYQDHCMFMAGTKVDFGDPLPFPHWICQPYVRPATLIQQTNDELPDAIEKIFAEREQKHAELRKLAAETGMSKRLVKRLYMRTLSSESETVKKLKPVYVACSCGNPVGQSCERNMCRICCRKNSEDNILNCSGHKFWFYNQRQRRLLAQDENVS